MSNMPRLSPFFFPSAQIDKRLLITNEEELLEWCNRKIEDYKNLALFENTKNKIFIRKVLNKVLNKIDCQIILKNNNDF